VNRCGYLDECTFFNETVKEMLATADGLKSRYCFGDHARCARLKVRRVFGDDAVPPELAPNDHERAQKILAGWV